MMAPKKTSIAPTKEVPKSAASGNVPLCKTPEEIQLPKGKYSKGKAQQVPNRLSNENDIRHIMYTEGLKPGVAIFWLKKYNKNEEPYLKYDYANFELHPQKLRELGISVVLDRKGTDGITALKQSPTLDDNWKQFIAIVEEKNNTPEKRKSIAEKLMAYLNMNLKNPDMYWYKYQIRFGGDLTSNPMRPLDAVLLDTDVIGFIESFMESCYEDYDLDYVAEFDQVMQMYWTNIENGKKKMEDYM